MNDAVRSIFMTLIKIPCFIVISYMIFNIFAFGSIYFKMLGVSYMVSEVALENNYIPPTEMASLEKYFAQLDGDNTYTEINGDSVKHTYYREGDVNMPDEAKGHDTVTLIDNLHLVINTDGTGNEPATLSDNNNTKVQYGNSVRAGISWDYYWIWPLISVNNNSDEYSFNYKVRGYEKETDGKVEESNEGDKINHSKTDSDEVIEYKKEKAKHQLHMSISYVVPGMKYYPDLD